MASRASAYSFPCLDRDCPGVLDTLIGLEEHGFIPFATEEGNIEILALTNGALPPEPPAWLRHAMESNRYKLAEWLRKRPREGDVSVTVVFLM